LVKWTNRTRKMKLKSFGEEALDKRERN
jgi:hypothetical protein